MRRTLLAAIALLPHALAGCGGAPAVPTAEAKPGPTGGTMFPLPRGKGFVEIKSEAGAPDRKARGRGHSSTIVATFYGPDGTAALSPAPTDVSAKLGSDETNKTVPLSPADPKSPGRFASAQGDYPDSPRGTLSAKVDGEPVEVPFAAR